MDAVQTRVRSKMTLSVVTTLYYSSRYLDEFWQRIRAAAELITPDFELILVNDGSPDDSLRHAVGMQQTDSRIIIVDLSRNFGHHQAIMTGLEMARGDFVFLIDSDLEDRPEFLSTFYARMQEQHCDVVYGYQTTRKGGAVSRWGGSVFYWLTNHMSDIKIPPNATMARLMTRRYVDSLLQFREREISLFGLWAAAGYEQIGVPVVTAYKGATSYTFAKRLAVALRQITSFSSLPLTLAAVMGAGISGIAFVVMLFLFVDWLAEGSAVAGWLSIIASIWLLGGMTIFFIGMTGLYVSKIFMEVKQRPHAIVRHIYRRETVAAE